MRTDRVLAAFLLALCLVAAVGSWIVHPPSGSPSLALTGADTLSGGGPAQIAVFDLYGDISDAAPADGFSQSRGVNATRVIRLLRQAQRDGVKAIVLHVNSPGGTAASSAAIYDELMRIRIRGKVPIVASFGDVAASGAYYLSSAADWIVAQPSSLTGSIGVVAHSFNVQGVMGKIGVSEITIKSGPYKDILSPFRPVQPAEHAMLQHMVDEIYGQFLHAVSAGRPQRLPLAKLKPLADGRVFTGQDAVKLGLVDQLGTYQDALRKAAQLAGIRGEPRVRDYTGQSLLQSLFSVAM
ncbi:MAG: signal peptide peptidase SppA, partial [Cyanobacteria bacterium REEB65]|nr:signal peptide peptidase SppA [Cyanobacteria bacterium REEB65]